MNRLLLSLAGIVATGFFILFAVIGLIAIWTVSDPEELDWEERSDV